MVCLTFLEEKQAMKKQDQATVVSKAYLTFKLIDVHLDLNSHKVLIDFWIKLQDFCSKFDDISKWNVRLRQ